MEPEIIVAIIGLISTIATVALAVYKHLQAGKYRQAGETLIEAIEEYEKDLNEIREKLNPIDSKKIPNPKNTVKGHTEFKGIHEFVDGMVKKVTKS